MRNNLVIKQSNESRDAFRSIFDVLHSYFCQRLFSINFYSLLYISDCVWGSAIYRHIAQRKSKLPATTITPNLQCNENVSIIPVDRHFTSPLVSSSFQVPEFHRGVVSLIQNPNHGWRFSFPLV